MTAYLSDLRFFATWFARTNDEEMSLPAITLLEIYEYRQHLLTVRRRKPDTCHGPLTNSKRHKAKQTFCPF